MVRTGLARVWRQIDQDEDGMSQHDAVFFSLIYSNKGAIPREIFFSLSVLLG